MESIINNVVVEDTPLILIENIKKLKFNIFDQMENEEI